MWECSFHEPVDCRSGGCSRWEQTRCKHVWEGRGGTLSWSLCTMVKLKRSPTFQSVQERSFQRSLSTLEVDPTQCPRSTALQLEGSLVEKKEDGQLTYCTLPGIDRSPPSSPPPEREMLDQIHHPNSLILGPHLPLPPSPALSYLPPRSHELEPDAPGRAGEAEERRAYIAVSTSEQGV